MQHIYSLEMFQKHLQCFQFYVCPHSEHYTGLPWCRDLIQPSDLGRIAGLTDVLGIGSVVTGVLLLPGR